MKNKLKTLFIAMALIMVVTPLIWYGSQFYWQNKTKKLHEIAQSKYMKQYTYVIMNGSLDQVMYSEDKESGIKLAGYYSKVSNYYEDVKSGKRKREKIYSHITKDTGYIVPVIIPVPLQHIGVEQEIYVEEISETDSVVKAYVFNTKCWGYYEAYLAKSTIHNELPPDSLLEDFIKHVHSLPSREGTTFGKPSPYGFYCN